jgi:multiple sugar transport system substrate-binding protein
MATKLTRRHLLRIGALGGAGLALPVGLAGCGGDGDDDAGGGNGNGGGGEAVTLTWWDYYDAANQEAVQQLHTRYMEANPNVTVERRALQFEDLKNTLLRGASAGDLPDIVVIDNPDHAAFAELGVFEDLTDRVQEWGKEGDYFEGPWQSTVWKDRNYGIPDNSNCLTLWYNQDLLEAAGLEPPTDWDELNAAARALSGDGVYGFAACAFQSEEGTFQWLPFLWQSGEDLDTLDSAGGRAALQLWVDLVRDGAMSEGVLGWDQAAVKDAFVNGQAAMMVNGPWQIPVVQEEAPDLNWGVVPLPVGETGASILGGENYAIVAGSPNVDAAWDLLTWSQEPDVLKEYLTTAGKLPSHAGMADDPEWSDDPVIGAFTEQLEVAKPRAYGPNYPEISSEVQLAMQAAISGESSVEDALARAQETVTPLLEG